MDRMMRCKALEVNGRYFYNPFALATAAQKPKPWVPIVIGDGVS